MSLDETTIRQWADRHECRRNLPIMIRRLIRETTPALKSMRFPGNEAVDLAGLDGQAEAGSGTKWVPQGKSVWEMGCNQNPSTKADDDYQKRTAETPEEEREKANFIFVTPRRWNSKDEWIKARRSESEWASVYAYDAIDLETWLEEAPVTSRWMSELLHISRPGLLTPHAWWERWSTASVPPISTSLVASRRNNEADTLVKKLREGESFITIQADDQSEAVAFVVASLVESDALDLLDRMLVATKGGISIPDNTVSRLIVIADVPEGQEPDFGDRRNITIVRAYPRGRMDVQGDIQLSHVPAEHFSSELESMGMNSDHAHNLALQVGHSIPVLRRRLSPDPEIRRPSWAQDRTSAKRFLPFALAGSWNERQRIDDNTVLQLLGAFSDGELERTRDEFLALDDAPIVKYGNVNIVVSQIDALFAVGPYIKQADLHRFFELVPELFGDRDPVLDLPQDQWWMANFLGKERSFSDSLLSGLGDALCILAVHGAEICANRLQIDLSYKIGQVIRALMQDANEERWLSIRRRLRMFAEASPITFLDCLEQELHRADPPIRAIMGITDGLVGGECLRTDLLWALELLAWDPLYFSRVAQIVFELQRFKVNDNWANSPSSTAKALFCAWFPATSVGIAERMNTLRNLSKQYRDATIEVCISLLPGGFNFASKTAMPHWRPLVKEVPEPTNSDVLETAIAASHLLLEMKPFNKSEIQKLLEIARRLHPDDLKLLVEEIESWAADASDEEKAELRDALRGQAVSRAYQEGDENKILDEAFQQLEAVLEPEMATAKHRWLFDHSYIEWPKLVQEEGEERLTWEERESLIMQRRSEAIAEIKKQIGEEQIFSFALSVKQPELVAQVLVSNDTPHDIAANWIGRVLEQEPCESSNTFLRQLIFTASRNDLKSVIQSLLDNGVLDDDAVRFRLVKHLPGTADGWTVAEDLGEDFVAAYWETVSVCIWRDTPLAEIEFAVENLLKVHRPRSAFTAAFFEAERLSSEQWISILETIAQGEEPEAAFPDAYRLDEVLKHLDTDPSISDAEIATLELPFVPLLCGGGSRNHKRTLAVHRELARDPSFFIQLLVWMYKRRDGTLEPLMEDIPLERQQFLAKLANDTLAGWNIVPGLDDAGEINKDAFICWTEEAFQKAIEVDRKQAAETHFGSLLAKFARNRKWEDWLPSVVLEFLNRSENGELREKFALGIHNARGVTSRGPFDGGVQERELAEEYFKLAKLYQELYPRVSVLLTSIAEDYQRDACNQDESATMRERWES